MSHMDTQHEPDKGRALPVVLSNKQLISLCSLGTARPPRKNKMGAGYESTRLRLPTTPRSSTLPGPQIPSPFATSQRIYPAPYSYCCSSSLLFSSLVSCVLRAPLCCLGLPWFALACLDRRSITSPHLSFKRIYGTSLSSSVSQSLTHT